MSILIKAMFVVVFAVSPVYLLDVLVMPALQELAVTYNQADATAQNIAR